MKTVGVHIIGELSNCNRDAITSMDAVRHALYAAAAAANATALNGYFHKFSPTGISGLLCLAESHISIHTWPEAGYAAVDVYTCGDTMPFAAISTLATVFEAKSIEVRQLDRGIKNHDGSFGNRETTTSMAHGGRIALPSIDSAEPPVKRAWYVEDADPFERHLYEVAEWLVSKQSKYQQIGIIRNRSYGKVLFLDGAVQSSQRDEYIYHEALIHPALIMQSDPRRVLILGGGEGAPLREVLRHKTVEQATMVDLDGELVELCKHHLPEWSAGAYEDPRTRLVIADGKEWLEKTDERFDVIFMDLTDQIDLGASFELYTQQFYQTIRSRLNPKGILLIQAGELSMCEYFSHCTIRKTLSTIFPTVQTYIQHVPTFFAQWSFIVATESSLTQLNANSIDARIAGRMFAKPKFYDGSSHQHMFMLPKDLIKVLDSTGTVVDQLEKFADAYERSQILYTEQNNA